MNDRFKFRVWNKENNKYEDDLYYEAGDLQVTCVNKIFEEYISDGCIIEQCTGLKDKNGKLIYENDLVIDDANIFEVVWDYNAWYIQTNKFQHFLTEGFEVIGNIHENANLIKVGGK